MLVYFCEQGFADSSMLAESYALLISGLNLHHAVQFACKAFCAILQRVAFTL